MQPDRGELAAAILACRPLSIWELVAAGGITPEGLADAILAHWPGPETMDGEQAAEYAAELVAELGRALTFIRDDLAGNAALSGRLHTTPDCWCGTAHTLIDSCKLNGLHQAGDCWCGQAHTVPGARSLNRPHP